MKNKKIKTCLTYKQSKDINDFGFSNKEKGYILSSCKSCKNKLRHIKRMQDPDKEHLRIRRKSLKQKYGITLEEYSRLYTLQNGECKICLKYEAKLCVDHCHDSMEVRGLLCNYCNSGLGFFKDNSNYLESAVGYLKNTCSDKKQ